MAKNNSKNKEWESCFMLPTNTVPIFYDLFLNPNLEKGTFKGEVNIIIQVTEERRSIICHTKHLDIKNTKLIMLEKDSSKYSEEVTIKEYFEYKPNEFWVITVESSILPGLYKLILEFSGKLREKIVGFYEGGYIDPKTKQRKNLAMTQFQPTYARQAFPCFDQPNFKSKFLVKLVRPSKGYSALSNMDQVKEIPDSPKPGLTIVEFQESVLMPTYLLCFVISDFQRLPPIQITQGFPFSVYSTPFQVSKTKYPLEMGASIMEYFIKYFIIPFPLPKLDNIAIPDFHAGAMENWGLITYREAMFLYDANFSSSLNKWIVVIVIAHELAHMWFGNLYKGVNHAHPDWEPMELFPLNNLHVVMKLDAVLSSHPIVQKVEHPDEITKLFDLISYLKAASIIRMMEDFMGEENFRKGIISFLNKFEFVNAVTQDLWDELQNIVPDIDITRIMDSWTRQMGFPVVQVSLLKGGNRELRQSRFLADSTAKKSKKYHDYRWDVPITYITGSNNEVHRAWFMSDMESLSIYCPASEPWVKFNYRQIGYYRVNYDPTEWKTLSDVLYTDENVFNPSDRAHLLEDAFKLADSGLLDYKTPLELSHFLEKETHFVPWATAYNIFSFLHDMLSHTGTYPKLREYVSNIVIKAYNNLGWEVKDNDSYLRKRARSIVLKLACEFGHSKCLKEVSRRFFVWISSPEKRLHPDIRDIIYQFGMYAMGDETAWDKMWNLFLKEEDAQEKRKLMIGLASAPQPWLINRYIQYAKNESNVRSEDFYWVLFDVSNNPIGRPIAWDFLRSEWKYINDRYSINDNMLNRMINWVCRTFASEFKLREIETFFSICSEAGLKEDAQEKRKLMIGLASASQPWLINRYIQYAKNESNVKSQDFYWVLLDISYNPIGKAIAWDFLRSEWEYIINRYTLNDSTIGRMIDWVCRTFASEFKLREIEAFFSIYSESGASEDARIQILEKVSNNIKWQTFTDTHIKTKALVMINSTNSKARYTRHNFLYQKLCNKLHNILVTWTAYKFKPVTVHTASGKRGEVTSVLVITFRAREVVSLLLEFLPDIRSSSPSLTSEIFDITNKNYTS
uniref:glutamyl aminopeptidase n=1 Tax=Timema bartmani TaxID=61472 RepID=A0A7R9ET20_9NEOP|nr:unnamed protein product [Timema bartmani]